MAINDALIARAQNLIDYLIEVARLKSNVTRQIDEYEKVLWIHEIPRKPKYCFTQAWGPNENYEADTWIEIIKYEEPDLINPPKICEPWVENSQIYNTGDLPSIKDKIHLHLDNPYLKKYKDKINLNSTESILTLKIEDFPEVSKGWEEYLENTWIPWSDLHNEWDAVNDVYSKLFTIYQEIQKLGEEYELVLGIGLIRWKTSSGQKVKRHVITAKAHLAFEADKGRFIVTPSSCATSLIMSTFGTKMG